MSSGTLAGLASLPILLAGILLVGFRAPARIAMPLVYVTAAGIALYFWDMSLANVAASSVEGLFTTFDLLLIIFGAIFLLNTLEKSGGVSAIRRSFNRSFGIWNPRCGSCSTNGSYGIPGSWRSDARDDDPKYRCDFWGRRYTSLSRCPGGCS